MNYVVIIDRKMIPSVVNFGDIFNRFTDPYLRDGFPSFEFLQGWCVGKANGYAVILTLGEYADRMNGNHFSNKNEYVLFVEVLKKNKE